jgi:hypothetical protein
MNFKFIDLIEGFHCNSVVDGSRDWLGQTQNLRGEVLSGGSAWVAFRRGHQRFHILSNHRVVMFSSVYFIKLIACN